jgi:hypothetical protein
VFTLPKRFDDESEMRNPRKIKSSFSKRKEILWKPLRRRNKLSISLCFL